MLYREPCRCLSCRLRFYVVCAVELALLLAGGYGFVLFIATVGQ